MTKSPEERLASLEQNFISLGEGVQRVEKAVDDLNKNVSTLVDKLDYRYPSKESVDLRLKAQESKDEVLEKEIGELKEEVKTLKSQVNSLKKFQYKATGALVFVAFALGILVRSKAWW